MAREPVVEGLGQQLAPSERDEAVAHLSRGCDPELCGGHAALPPPGRRNSQRRSPGPSELRASMAFPSVLSSPDIKATNFGRMSPGGPAIARRRNLVVCGGVPLGRPLQHAVEIERARRHIIKTEHFRSAPV